jgi:nicotinate-nucleotide pyrophosphorylase (carboxylating)
MYDWELEDIVSRALKEDIGHQDMTTFNLIPAEQIAEGIFIAKESGVIAGIDVCRAVFTFLDPAIDFR